MSTIKTNAILDASGGSTTTINGVTPSAYNTMGKNRIINGAMEIDQRNAGASVTPTTNVTYTLDRWAMTLSQSSKYSVQQQTSIVPVGFTNAMKFTSLSSYSVGAEVFGFRQMIEGYNVADLGWGTANAKSITLSFYVYSSLTGTFGGALLNSAENRSYPFEYTISSANTWEKKTVTIAGDTSGTWVTNNGTGIQLHFSLGVGSSLSGTAGAWAGTNYYSATGATSVVGTSGATLYITGVQLEVGSTATEFERRPYGTELALCQRYCQVINSSGSLFGTAGSAIAFSNNYVIVTIPLVTSMRTTPSSVTISNASDWCVTNYSSSWTWSSFVLSTVNSTSDFAEVEGTVTSSTLTTGNYYVARANTTTNARLTFSAEL